MAASARDKLTITIERNVPTRGAHGAIYAGTVSAKGAWLGGGSFGTLSIVHTTDGEKFQKRKTPEAYQLRSLLALDTGTLLGGGQYGLFRSDDGGKEWSEITSFQKPGGPSQCWRLALDERGVVWGGSDGVLAWSQDLVTWSHLQVMPSGGFDGVFAFGDRVYAIEGKDLYVIRGGAVEAQHQMSAALAGMARGADGTMLLVGANGLVMRSKDGDAWQTLPAPSVELTGIAWCTDRFVLVGKQGTVLSTANGDAFTRHAIAKGDDIVCHCVVSFGTGALIGGTRDGAGMVMRLGPPVAAGKASKPKPPPEKPMPPPRTRVLAASIPAKGNLGLRDGKHLTLADVGDEYGIADRIEFGPEPNHPVLVYRGNLVVDRFETPKPVKGKLPLVVIDGSLIVEHDLDLAAHEDDDDYLFVLVKGNVSARTAWIQGDGVLEVEGSFELEDCAVIGEGNAFIEIGGTLSARALLIGAAPRIKATTTDALVVGWPQNADFSNDDIDAVVRDTYLDDSGVDSKKARKAMQSGKDLLRKTIAAR